MSAETVFGALLMIYLIVFWCWHTLRSQESELRDKGFLYPTQKKQDDRIFKAFLITAAGFAQASAYGRWI